MSPKQSGPGLGLISIVDDFRRDEARRIAANIDTHHIVMAVENLLVRSCFVDGEAIVVDHGLSLFDFLRYRQHDRAAVLRA